MIGGFCNQLYQNHIQKKKQDRDNFVEVLKFLIGLNPKIRDQYYPDNFTVISDQCKRIFECSIKIQTRKYRGIVAQLIDFTKKNGKAEEQEIIDLIELVSKEASKPLDRLHKKESKFFKKCHDELQRKSKMKQ